MNLRDLHYVLAVADTLNFGKAAERVHVSQSTLSIQIKKMEELLGVTLFERNNKQVMVTPVGRDILAAARRIAQEEANIKTIAATHRDPWRGEVRLGAFPTLAPYILPMVLPALRKTLPHISWMFVEEKTDQLLEQLRRGAVDCALIAEPVEEEGLGHCSVFEEAFLLAVPSAHALAKAKTITLPQLRDERVLLLDEGHCLRAQSLALCERIGIGEAQHYRATSLETLRHMVAANAGLTFMPALAARATPGVRYVAFADKHVPERVIGLYWRKTSYRAQVFQRIAQLIAAAVARHQSPLVLPRIRTI